MKADRVFRVTTTSIKTKERDIVAGWQNTPAPMAADLCIQSGNKLSDFCDSISFHSTVNVCHNWHARFESGQHQSS
jgi:hypothetical protein